MIPARSPGGQDGKTPSPTLPLRYLLGAAVAFVLAALGVPWLSGELAAHYYHPRVVALTHMVALGWITLTVMGASYQLIPLVLERPLWSERLARWQFVIFVGGVIGMVAHFWIARWNGLVWAAGVVGLGMTAHVVNVGLSLRGIPRWTFTARCFALALVGLAGTVLFGLTLGANRLWGFFAGDLLATLHAHFHLALLGWIAPVVVGVSARVYPMFLLAPEPSGWPGRLQLWGLGLGVPAVVAGLLVEPVLLVPGALAVGAALGAHATWVLRMVRARKRPTLDWGLRFALTGTACLVPAAALGLAFAGSLLGGPRAALAYAVLALGGWVSLTIVGMMLEIVPFLVWFRVYGPRVGKEPVPTLAQLSWPPMERLAYALLTGGVLALAGGVAAGARAWIGVAGAAVAAGAVGFVATLVRTVLHLARGARTEPAAPPLGAGTR